MRIPKFRLLAGGAIAALVGATLLPSTAAGAPPPLGDQLAIPGGKVTATFGKSADLDPSLRTAKGTVNVTVGLADASLAEQVVASGNTLSKSQQQQYVNGLKAKQSTVGSAIKGLGGRERARLQKSLNSVVVAIDASKVDEVAAIPGVESVRRLYNYQLDLSETVPYIGATALHERNPTLTGKGIRVAVLDSGIDYTHVRFGGAGTAQAYADAYGTSVTDPKTTTPDGLFPTSKVIGGFDFVGEKWPNGPIEPDPDPIDCGTSAIAAPCAGGHGSHVASIIAGNNGVAPDAKLYMAKVCSAVSSSCDGPAILQGIEFALDPNGDGDVSDAADVVNLSLGSPYGQPEDDSSAALANAIELGVVVVTSSGNSGDKPYITGSPGSTPGIIATAQTNVPSARHFVLRIGSDVHKNTNVVDWAPITTGFTGDVKYGATAADQLGCEAYPSGFFAGKVALLDRGTCSISIKVDNAADAGAIGVLVANNAPGAAPSFSFGGPATFDPQQTLIIGQEHGTTIKAALASGPVTAAVDPADAVSLKGSMVATSSRGPNYATEIKPDIGAPGASVSAEAGTGTGETAFGGTSGAAPMVAGSAALLRQAYPKRDPLEIKAALQNNADTDILINPVTQPGVLAEISRVGAGEVRVDAAADAKVAAWDDDEPTAGLSFGFQPANDDVVVRKTVRVRNYSSQSRTFQLGSSFRYANDEANGAVELDTPASVTVPGNRTKTFRVTMRIDADKLPDWGLDSGPNGATGSLLAGNEYDGYLTLSHQGEQISLPWHVLPHRNADIEADEVVRLRNGAASVQIRNVTRSGQPGELAVFGLMGQSPRIPKAELPKPGGNRAVVDLRSTGVRAGGDVMQFAVNTFNEHEHASAPGQFRIQLDTNRDGTADWTVFNADLTVGSTGQYDGRNVVWIQQVGSTTANAFFFTDADLNSANTILTVPLAAVGLTPTTTFDYTVQGVDSYFTNAVTDQIAGLTFTPSTPRFVPSLYDFTVAAGARTTLGVSAPAGGAAASPSQTGLLLMKRDAPDGAEADVVKVVAQSVS
ncbi:S8 family peptidase [Tenggerimyces flavus]|uniref:S8 family serine peptidase n=1 Tax=Tenggerimyces flavus TaxID=1708749 RepID=A0ABV7YCT4_9ACTN|nr:S8 family serine peptidase [Tenggerimyces flavus]MBM7787119.1 subtilisin family serine protease [Tenggerimyces flavus]